MRQELKEILGLDAEPLFLRIYRWPRSMAQYSVGHLARVARIEEAARRLPGFALAGNAFHGIGVPDCIRSGSGSGGGGRQTRGEPTGAGSAVIQQGLGIRE